MLISSITTYTSLTALLATGSKHQLFPKIRLKGPKLPWSEEFDLLWLTWTGRSSSVRHQPHSIHFAGLQAFILDFLLRPSCWLLFQQFIRHPYRNFYNLREARSSFYSDLHCFWAIGMRMVFWGGVFSDNWEQYRPVFFWVRHFTAYSYQPSSWHHSDFAFCLHTMFLQSWVNFC